MTVTVRPMGLPGLGHRAARSAWLAQADGEARQLAVLYIASTGTGISRLGQYRDLCEDVEALLSSKMTVFEEFALLLAGGASNHYDYKGLSIAGVTRLSAGVDPGWWSRLLRACFEESTEPEKIRSSAKRVHEASQRLLEIAWPDLPRSDWLHAYRLRPNQAAALALKSIQQASSSSGQTGDRPTLRQFNALPVRMTREEAVAALMPQVSWDAQVHADTVELRETMVIEAIASGGVVLQLRLLDTEDRLRILGSVTCSPHDRLRSIIECTPMPPDEARKHLTCAQPAHRCSLVLNPWVDGETTSAAVRKAAFEASPSDDYAQGAVGTLIWLEVLLVARGWLDPEVIGKAYNDLVRLAAGCQGASTIAHTRWNERSRLDGAALGLVVADGVPPVNPEVAALVREKLRSEGNYVSSWIVSLLPKDARLLCATAALAANQPGFLVNGATDDILLEMPEEARVLAARHGQGTTLQSLSGDPSVRVRQHVARNIRTPVRTLRLLVRDPEPKVSTQVARNNAVTQDVLAEMAALGGAPAKAASRAVLMRIRATG